MRRGPLRAASGGPLVVRLSATYRAAASLREAALAERETVVPDAEAEADLRALGYL